MAELVVENRNRLMVPQIQIVIDDTSRGGDDSFPIKSFNGHGGHEGVWDNEDDDGEYGYELEIDEYFNDSHRFEILNDIIQRCFYITIISAV